MNLYHYTKASTLIEHILPKMRLQSNHLKSMNDPREMQAFAFSGVNVPYAEIYKDYYSNSTHIDCMYKLGEEIKDRIQVICFSGSNGKGWNNEMMWAHYGAGHKGVCIEIDEDILIQNLKPSISQFMIDNINYSEEADRTIYWDNEKSIEDNINQFILNKYKDLACKKSKCWTSEDERRLIIINQSTKFLVPIENAITGIYLGTHFVKEYLPSIKSQISSDIKLWQVIYQHYKFERWDANSF